MSDRSGAAGAMPGVTTGVDLVAVERIDRMVARWGDKFLKRVFTDGEIAYATARAFPARSLAARFAAKEAFYKAVSPWRGGPIVHKNIEVVVGEDGVPAIVPHGNAGKALGNRTVSLSLSHEQHLAVAVVVTSASVGGKGARP